MNFNKILKAIFGDKSTRDMKLIQPYVDKVKATYPEIKALSNDELRAKTKEIQKYVQDAGKEQREKIAELRTTIEATPIEEREAIFNQIDKLEKEALDNYEKALDEVMPVAFSIVKDTARRFAENEETIVTATDFDRELAADPSKDFITIDGDKAIYHNHWTAGGNDLKWEMVHYDVQIFGGVVLHQGKIAEMATGEGKTLVATLPVFLNALTGNGVHVVTVNDYLAKRDSEWMGPLYMFNGLSVDCIDKHQPNSPSRRKAYQADITFGTNNEFGFDYLRDNMAVSPADLVQRQHNYAIVDEVDSVLIDDARTPLIISGPVPKGDVQMFEEFQPLVQSLYEVQRKQATELLSEARHKLAEAQKNANNKETFQKLQEEGFLALYRSFKALPKNKALIKFLSEEGIKAGMLKTEEYYMANNNREMPKAIEPLYFVTDEKMNSCDLTDKGTAWLAAQVKDDQLFVLPDITTDLSELEKQKDDKVIDEQTYIDKKDAMMAHYGVQSERVHTLQQLLKAYTMFNKDDEYVVLNGEVKIVDEQTGRIMEGRRWSDGLHQAVEAKEHVKVEAATQTFATITLQNYFRMYHKLAGMTGTASTEAGEFWDIYKLDVVEIPTNRPILRKDMEDRVYKTAREKYAAVIDEVEAMRNQGRPCLVGTTSVEISELLLRGRAGRQGDPGSSVFYVSLEDKLMRLFGSERIAKVMDRLGFEDGERIESSMISNSIERAQKKVEENNFGIRKRLLEYDDVMNKQRTVIYEKRRHALMGERIGMDISNIIWDRCVSIVENNDYEGCKEAFLKVLAMECPFTEEEFNGGNTAELAERSFQAAMEAFNRKTERIQTVAWPIIKQVYENQGAMYERIMVPITDGKRVYNIPCDLKEAYESEAKSVVKQFEKVILLHIIDDDWKENLRQLDDLRHSVQNASYEQKDPLLIFKLESVKLWDNMIDDMNNRTASVLMRGQIPEMQPADEIQEAAPEEHSQQYKEEKVELNDPNQVAAAQHDTREGAQEVNHTPYRAEKMPLPNDPCPCGSGKKFKKCHGRNIR